MTPNIKKTETGVSVQIILPFREGNSIPKLREAPKYQCLKDNKEALIKAVKARMQACYDSLVKGMDNIVYNDGYTIHYKVENKYSYFNLPSWEVMEKLLKALEEDAYYNWDIQMYEQLLKSVVLHSENTLYKNYDKMVCYLINHLAVQG